MQVAGGTILKHVPPGDAAKPDRRWRLYVFKNDELQDEPFHIHRMDHYLFGGDMKVGSGRCTALVQCMRSTPVASP